MVNRFLALAAIAIALAAGPALAQDEQFFPALVYRAGAYAPNGIPFANGFADYLNLLNARDGGINGVKITLRNARQATPPTAGSSATSVLKARAQPGRACLCRYRPALPTR